MNTDQVRSISDNVWTVFVARIAMISTPFVASGLVYFGSQWLEGKFDLVTVPLQRVESRVDVLERGDRTSELKNQSQDFLIQSNGTSVSKITDQVEKLGRKIDEVNSSLQSLTDVLADRERRAGRQ